jgi:hypothetical protein
MLWTIVPVSLVQLAMMGGMAIIIKENRRRLCAL